MLGSDFHLKKDSLKFIRHVCLNFCNVSANMLGDPCLLRCHVLGARGFPLVALLPLSLSYQGNSMGIVLGCIPQK